MRVTKGRLGIWYIVGSGGLLSAAIVLNVVGTLDETLVMTVIAASGLVPAVTLLRAHDWLAESGLDGEQIWRVAEWGGLGIAMLTLANLVVLTVSAQSGQLTAAVLGASVAVGAAVGVLLGWLLELRRTARRLSQRDDVLFRIIQHNLRNDLTVMLGHVDELEDHVDEPGRTCLEDLRGRVDGVATMTDKVRQIDVAFASRDRTRRSVDVVPIVESRLNALRTAHPDAEVETDLPATAEVRADWLLESAVDNLVENAVVHADGAPRLRTSVERTGDWVVLTFADDCPRIPENERRVLETGTESILEHSTGVGLWLVQWIVDGYGGEMTLGESERGGNAVTLRLPAADAGLSAALRRRLR